MERNITMKRLRDEIGFKRIFKLDEEITVKEVRYNTQGQITLITTDDEYVVIEKTEKMSELPIGGD